MTSITPCRRTVSDRFPVASFVVSVPQDRYFEVACATDPSLFHAAYHGRRSPSNFYSSRSAGLMRAPAGQATYILPAEQLKRFAGAQRIHFAVASYGSPRGADPVTTLRLDELQRAPYFSLAPDFKGRALDRSRLIDGGSSGEYGGAGRATLTWGGDLLVGQVQARGSTSLDYDDGFDAALWQGRDDESAALEDGGDIEPGGDEYLDDEGLSAGSGSGFGDRDDTDHTDHTDDADEDDDLGEAYGSRAAAGRDHAAEAQLAYGAAHLHPEAYGSVQPSVDRAGAYGSSDEHDDVDDHDDDDDHEGIEGQAYVLGDADDDDTDGDDTDGDDTDEDDTDEDDTDESGAQGVSFGGTGASPFSDDDDGDADDDHDEDADEDADGETRGDKRRGRLRILWGDDDVNAHGLSDDEDVDEQEDSVEVAAASAGDDVDGFDHHAAGDAGDAGDAGRYVDGDDGDDGDEAGSGSGPRRAGGSLSWDEDETQHPVLGGRSALESIPVDDVDAPAGTFGSAYGSSEPIQPADLSTDFFDARAAGAPGAAAAGTGPTRGPTYGGGEDLNEIDLDDAPTLDAKAKASLLYASSELDGESRPFGRFEEDAEEGVRVGVGRFGQRSGALGRMLRRSHDEDPAAFENVYGAHWEDLLRVTGADSPERRMASVGGHTLADPEWRLRFDEAAEHRPFQRAQLKEAVEGSVDPNLRFASRMGLRRDRALAVLVDESLRHGARHARATLAEALCPVKRSDVRAGRLQQLDQALEQVGYGRSRGSLRERLAAFQQDEGVEELGRFGAETQAALTHSLRRSGVRGPLAPPRRSAAVLRTLVIGYGGPHGHSAGHDRMTRMLFEPNPYLTDADYALGA